MNLSGGPDFQFGKLKYVMQSNQPLDDLIFRLNRIFDRFANDTKRAFNKDQG